MSNYGVFEASSTDGHEEEQRQRKAKRNLGTAIEAAREGFGDFLGSSTDKQDYQDRLALVMNDLMQKVADAGVMPVPGVMRKVKAALRPEFRAAAPQIAPHPDYGEGVWSDEGVKQRVLSLDPNLPTPELVDAIMREMGDFYDSIDRELAFWYFSQVTGNDYDDYYNAWMNIPSGKYFSRKRSRRVQANDYGPDTYPTAMDAFQAWLVDEGLTDAEGPVLMTFQDRHGEGWSDDDLDIDLSLVDKGNAFTSTRKQASGWYQEYDGSWSITLPGDVVGWLRPTDDPELPDTFTVSAEIDNEENGRELFTEFGISEAEGKRMVEEAAAKVIASRRKAGLSDWFIDGTDFAQMSYDGMPDGNFAFLNVYLHGDGYYMWSVDVENGQANHGKLNATDLESAIAEAEPLISAELGLDPFMYSTLKQAFTQENLGNGYYGIFYSAPSGKTDVDIFDSGDSLLTELTGADSPQMARKQAVEYVNSISSPEFASSRKQGSAYLPVVSVEQNTGDSYMAEISGGFAFEAYDEGGAWVWSIFDNSGDEVASDEASSLDAAKDAAAYALDRVASRKVDSRRKQAGSAQVLQKLENALNDQRSVDVICFNSPDGSFSGEREISVDEGLQKVRGWVSAGDLVDTAQGGGNFFDFEHRASGENVNFYITQEY